MTGFPLSSSTVTASFKAVDYAVTLDGSSGGSVTADRTSARYGDAVALTVAPDEGYELDSLTVADAAGGPVTVTDNKFTMPAADVKVTAVFKVIPPAVQGSLSGGKLKATVTSPAGSVLIAARFEGGRLDIVKLIPIDALNAGRTVDTGLAEKSGCSYSLMLVNGSTWSPLCEAWSAS